MFVLFNRIAWLVCFALGFGIFGTLFDGGGIVLGLITACICKAVLLPEDFIKSQLSGTQIAEIDENSQANSAAQKTIVEQEDDIFDIDLEEEEPVSTKTLISSKSAQEKQINAPSQIDIMLESWSKAISDFFSTNLLAKLGAILIFLGVLFLQTMYLQ